MRIYFFLLIFTILSSCSKSNLAYLSDIEGKTVTKELDFDLYDPKIQVGDLLSITMNSLNSESNALFNSGGIMFANDVAAYADVSNTMAAGYLVNKEGKVMLPIIGGVQIAGLTKEEATDKITGILRKYAKEPTVNIRTVNFKVTVIGEVNSPSTIVVAAERLNLLEALGYAGDLTPFGKRDNVLIIRYVNGERSTTRVNLNSKELLDSPYFYLLQNDIIYVEPNEAKALQASARTYNLPILLSLASLLAFIISTFQ